MFGPERSMNLALFSAVPSTVSFGKNGRRSLTADARAGCVQPRNSSTGWPLLSSGDRKRGRHDALS
jgi:hypothetical protein